MEYNTRLNRIHSKPEMNNGETKVDFAGYVSKRKRIEALMRAGERLVQARREQFDYVGDEDDPEIEIDPTRHNNYDLADATQAMHYVKDKLKVKKEDKKDEKVSEVVMENSQRVDNAKTEIMEQK